VVLICNISMGVNISFRLINTNEIGVADPDLCGTDRNIDTGMNISCRLINTNEISVADLDLCGTDPQNTAESYTNTGTGKNIFFRLINTNEISVADPDIYGTDPIFCRHRYFVKSAILSSPIFFLC
jgi:hypothetical protein